MIPKYEILDLATQTNVLPHVIEKDYALGWLLAGIHQHPALKESWVFKGGTCLKKCYFETYRFSEDLDFTLRDQSHIDERFLRETFESIGEWVYENSGIEVPSDRLMFEIYPNPRGKKAVQGRVFYRGPVTPAGKQAMPRIKLDLTADEVITDTPIERLVSHGYSDAPTDGIHILSYSYAEVFAEKIRALKERTRPRDLYDVVNFFRRPESRDIAGQVCTLLRSKCAFKNIAFPVMGDLDSHKDTCESGWREQLGHQLQSLPPFGSFWRELPDFFQWLVHPATIAVALPSIAFAEGESSGASLLGSSAFTPQFSILDRIRFAAVNRMCVELDYRKENDERKTYLIEPYSLRRTNAGNVILYAVKIPPTDDLYRSFRTDRMIGAKISERAFVPRYAIDFIPSGPANMSLKPNTGQNMPVPKAQATRTKKSHGGPQHFFKCGVCGKLFVRKTFDAALNPHKNKQGQPCPGLTGIFVTTKYR